MYSSGSIGAEWPSYLSLYSTGELARRAEAAMATLAACTLCPRRCRSNRLAGELGVCRSGALARVASWNRHDWEEPPISGTRGSGTIFFSGCTGACIFCQNYPISHLNHGIDAPAERLASMMLELQARGCHNINLVTGTHFVPQVLAALVVAVPQGFRLPLVYNTSGYETVETLRLLDGVVDIYLPDAKYADDAVARRVSGFKGYVEANRAALREMFRQVGPDLELDDEGIARRGMIIRHLVLPEGLAGSAEVAQWLASNLSPRLYVSIMSQYFPAYRAIGHPQLGRKITPEEYEAAVAAFVAAGLETGWQQEPDGT